MANKNSKKKLEEIAIPCPDPKNIVEELSFEDELTKLRCRGWLLLPSKTFLQANIIFPGSDIDCRLSIRTRLGSILLLAFFNASSSVPLGAPFNIMPYLVHENKISRFDRLRRRKPMYI